MGTPFPFADLTGGYILMGIREGWVVVLVTGLEIHIWEELSSDRWSLEPPRPEDIGHPVGLSGRGLTQGPEKVSQDLGLLPIHWLPCS